MGITSSTGIGSGIDINTLVSQLVKAEGQPTYNAIQRQTDLINTHLSGLGSLKSALSTFETAVSKLKDSNLFKTHAATASDESILKVTSGSGSAAGGHSIEVVNLAKEQNLISTTGYSSSSSPVTTTGGTLNFSYPSGSQKTAFTVTIAANATLADVRSAINSAAGNDGVTASIINAGTSAAPISKLVLTSRDTGVSNGFELAVTGGDAGLNLLDTATPSNYSKVAAADATINVDGLVGVTRSSNSISDVLQGITLDLKKEGTVNINVSLDTTAINKTVSDFVTAYNSLHTVARDLGKYGGSKDGSGSGNGALIGDSTLRYINTQIRQSATNVVSSATDDKFNSLALIGVTVDKDGVMALDSTKLKAALAANTQSVSDVFSSADGVATRLDAKLSGLLQSGGTFEVQQKSLNKQLTSLSDKKLAEDDRLASLQKALQRQYIAMDTAVGQFSSTGTFLTNWIKKL